VPVSTICQDCTLMLPAVAVKPIPVGNISAEAPATAFLNPTSNACPVILAIVTASNSACP